MPSPKHWYPYFCRLNYESFAIIDNIEFGKIYKIYKKWRWEIIGLNGKVLSTSKYYKNKAQCRNVGKRFAEHIGLDWRE